MSATTSVAQIKPLPGFVLIEPAPRETKTASGIYLPDSHKEKILHGTIIAIGDATVDHGVEVKAPAKVKDHVMYKTEWDSNELTVDGKEYQLVKFKDLLAVVASK